jgi:hypothetical protein
MKCNLHRLLKNAVPLRNNAADLSFFGTTDRRGPKASRFTGFGILFIDISYDSLGGDQPVSKSLPTQHKHRKTQTYINAKSEIWTDYSNYSNIHAVEDSRVKSPYFG